MAGNASLLFIGFGLSLSLLSIQMPAWADATHVVNAEVIRVTPVYGSSGTARAYDRFNNSAIDAGRVYRTECFPSADRRYRSYRADRYRADDPHARRDHRHGPGIIGGILGGLLGSQFGGGNGKTALTIAGAAIGASIARGRHDTRPHAEHEQRCVRREISSRSPAVAAYDVAYRYHGRTFHKRTQEHPGATIPVQVELRPRASSTVAAPGFSRDSHWQE